MTLDEIERMNQQEIYRLESKIERLEASKKRIERRIQLAEKAMTDTFEEFDTDTGDELPDDIQEWIETCDRILEDCEDVPERAEDFAISISEKIESMLEWIEKNKRITPKMIAAIENMDEALQRVRD